MSVSRQRKNMSYGIGQPLYNLSPFPIIASRAPTTSDKAEVGTVWTNQSTNAVWILSSIVSSSATWTSTSVNAGATITTGDFTVTAGDVIVTAGDITATAGDMTLTAGDLEVDAGSITAYLGDVTARTLFATGDATGTASSTAITSVTETGISGGTMAIKSTTANPGDSAGYIKAYVGVTAVYIPYFTNIAP